MKKNLDSIFDLARTHTPLPIPIALAVIFFDKEILFIKRAKEPLEGKWGFITGHVEKNENFSTAAKREAFEEAGLSVAIVQELGDHEEILDGQEYHIRCFLAKADTKMLRLKADEILKAEWLMPAEGLKLEDLATTAKSILEKFLKTD